MTYDRFVVLNERIKNNNGNFKVVILNVLGDKKVKIRRYEKERSWTNPRQKVWRMHGDIVVNIYDLINSTTENSYCYISNPSKIKNSSVFQGSPKLVINYDLLNKINDLIEFDYKTKKSLIFKSYCDNNLKLLLSKQSIKGTLIKKKLGLIDIFVTDKQIFVVGNSQMCCVDGQHLFEDWTLNYLDISEIDFSECDTLFKAFDTAYIDNLILDFNMFSNLKTISYLFIYSKIKKLDLYNLDLSSIIFCEDMFFHSQIENLVLKNCNFDKNITVLENIKGLRTISTDSELLDNALKKIIKI